MTESEWASILASDMDSSNTKFDHVPDAGSSVRHVEPAVDIVSAKRFEADLIEPEHRTPAQWLASSAVPSSVSAFAMTCKPEVKAFRQIAADLSGLHERGVDSMDLFDVMQSAVNAITWDNRIRRNHPLTAVPLWKSADSGRTMHTPGETMTRLRERFVVELNKAGHRLPDTDDVLADIEYRRSRRQQNSSASSKRK